MDKLRGVAHVAVILVACGFSGSAFGQYSGMPSVLGGKRAAPTAGAAQQDLVSASPVLRSTTVLIGNNRPRAPAINDAVAGAGVKTDISPRTIVGSSAAAGEGLTDVQRSLLQTGAAVVTVQPGQTNIFPVSLGHVNRIATPFHKAAVRTEASNGVDVSKNIIYVTPNSDAPISLFITEDGDESTVMSITLVPRLIPPVVLTLQLPPDPAAAATRPADNLVAANWEKGQPYVDTLRELLRGLAVNTIPPGYDLEEDADMVDAPVCAASPAAVDFRRGQKVVGSTIEVFIGVVRNTSAGPLEFNESWCNGDGVLAVALNPTPVIDPGATEEIYVARRIVQAADGVVARPSLVPQ
jgi:conjugal transfer pilus assembly protein TraK